MALAEARRRALFQPPEEDDERDFREAAEVLGRAPRLILQEGEPIPRGEPVEIDEIGDIYGNTKHAKFTWEDLKKDRVCIVCRSIFNLLQDVGTLSCKDHPGTLQYEWELKFPKNGVISDEETFDCCFQDIRSEGCKRCDHRDSNPAWVDFNEAIILWPMRWLQRRGNLTHAEYLRDIRDPDLEYVVVDRAA